MSKKHLNKNIEPDQDRIFITNLEVKAILGILEYERREPQVIRISAELFIDSRKSGQSDSIDNCIDYSLVAEELSQHTKKARRLTVEALAEDLAVICLKFSGVNKVRLRVEKPEAIAKAESVGIAIERYRE